MGIAVSVANRVVALACAGMLALLAPFGAARADVASPMLDRLFEQLRTAPPEERAALERKIWKEWSRSGSVALDALMERGRKQMEAGDFAEAIATFSTVIDHAPDFAEAWNARATAFFMTERYGLAMEDIEQVLRLNPRHFGAWSGLAMILERIGRPADALRAYREVLKLNPNRPETVAAVERLEAEVGGSDI